MKKKTSEALASLGYVNLEVKRLKRSEFDVVTQRNGIIYNFQCKNNFIDTCRANPDEKVVASLNQKIVNRHRNAILKDKEKKREDKLKERFPGQEIRHMVISRFPLHHQHKDLINFNAIEEWHEINNP